MRKFNCPYCSTSFEIPENVLQIKCTNCEKVIDINEKNDIDKLFETAEIAFKFKNYEEAYKFYTKIIELDLDNYLAWYWKALSAARITKLINLDFSETISSLEVAIKKAPAEKKILLKKDAFDDLFKFVSDVFDSCFIQFKRLISLQTYELFVAQSRNIIFLLEKLHEYDPNNVSILEKILFICDVYKNRYRCTLVNQYVFLLDAGRLEAEKKIDKIQKEILKISPSYNNKKGDNKKIETAKTLITKRPFSILALIAIFIFFILILIPFFITPRISSFFYPIWGVSAIFTIILFIFIFINKQPRKKWFIIFTIIAVIISIPSFIIATNFSYSPDNNLTVKETAVSAEAITTETAVVETTVLQTTTETNAIKQPNFSELTLEEKLEYIVISLLGETGIEDSPKIVDIEIASFTGENGPEGNTAFIILNGDDNLTKNMIKESMWIDSIKLFQEFFQLIEITRVDLQWQLPLVDVYGNTEFGVVMEILLTRNTAEKINWNTFLYQNLPIIADLYQEHQTFSN